MARKHPFATGPAQILDDLHSRLPVLRPPAYTDSSTATPGKKVPEIGYLRASPIFSLSARDTNSRYKACCTERPSPKRIGIFVSRVAAALVVPDGEEGIRPVSQRVHSIDSGSNSDTLTGRQTRWRSGASCPGHSPSGMASSRLTPRETAACSHVTASLPQRERPRHACVSINICRRNALGPGGG